MAGAMVAPTVPKLTYGRRPPDRTDGHRPAGGGHEAADYRKGYEADGAAGAQEAEAGSKSR